MGSVRAVVEQSLGTSSPGIGAVAGLLNVHPRTLQRRLRAAGTTFAEVIDEERRTAAHRYLTGTDLPSGRSPCSSASPSSRPSTAAAAAGGAPHPAPFAWAGRDNRRTSERALDATGRSEPWAD